MSEISRAETAAYRDARKTGRLDHPNVFRTASGSVVSYDNIPKRQPAWIQIVAPGPKPKERAESDAPKPENLAPFSGMNRAEKRRRMKPLGLNGSFTKELHHTLGVAWCDNITAKRLMRDNARTARLAAKYEAVSA